MSIIKEVYYKLDINTLEKQEENTDIKMNEMVKIRLRTTQPVVFDEYRKNRITGSLILVDESTNETVAAGTFL